MILPSQLGRTGRMNGHHDQREERGAGRAGIEVAAYPHDEAHHGINYPAAQVYRALHTGPHWIEKKHAVTGEGCLRNQKDSDDQERSGLQELQRRRVTTIATKAAAPRAGRTVGGYWTPRK